jgi:transcriptional regulator with XRE-family HTH domain
LRRRRLDLGISQRKLAERLGVSKRSIQTWERNQVKPSRTLALELRGYLQLPVPPHPTALAGRLMAFRKARRLTHEAMARLLGVHTSTVIRWETGKASPTTALIGKLETLLTGLSAGRDFEQA